MSTPTELDPSAPIKIADADRDALHILPLACISLKTPGLRRAKLIKNAQLNSVVEMFDDLTTGSGQIEVAQLKHLFSWPDSPSHPDQTLLRKLALLPSFDVYSLRILFRDNAIPITTGDVFSLSPAKVKELSSYMMTFTRPLIKEIYQDGDLNISSFDEILALFRTPDRKRAIENLDVMAKKLGIEIIEIPKFL